MPCPNAVDQDLVIIRIDNIDFSAMKPLLANSSVYFADLFNSEKHTQPKDGIYRIYGRIDMFPFILQYCHSHIYPLLFSEEKGFDKVGYSILLGESIRFCVNDLTKWIKEAKYKEMVKMHIKVEHMRFKDTCKFPEIVLGSNETMKIEPFQWTDQIYKCPRNIYVHRGKPEYCGRECHNAMPESGPSYEPEQNLGLVIIKKSYTIDYEALMPVMMSLSEEGWPGVGPMQE